MIFFVTGASAGFGNAIVRRLISDGHRVIAAARRHDKLNSLREELGSNVLPLMLDVCDEQAIAALPDTLPVSWQSIDVLINNAGLALGIEPAQQCQLNDWLTMVDTNVKGVITLTHALLPGMVARGSGLIINMGSIAGTYPYPGGNVYGATKAFVRQFSLNLRADLGGTGIRVTNIEPGLVGGSEFSDVRFRGDSSRVSALYDGAHALQPEDIAATVSWIASLPAHININSIEMMPTSQSFAALDVHRSIS